MNEGLLIQGRRLQAPDLQRIRQWLGEHPDWSRRRLSQALAVHWDWRNGAGQLKDMAARSLLGKLDQRGLIALPPRRQAPTNRMRGRARAVTARPPALAPSRLVCTLAQLGPLTLQEVSGERAGRAWLADTLAAFHYLGFGGAVGENLQYVVRDAQARPLAGLVFGAAAWKCQDRDQFLGWSAEQRQRNLGLLANNTRFLILPWVSVPHLASWILGRVSRRLGQDWQTKYGHALAALETFVERERFAGTAYQAANWIRVGQTTGRTRQDRHTCLRVPIKDIYLYPLRRDFRTALQA
ncbi:MAG: Druantia anti-phage system protein DruA [Candidatus Nanopelagicales bacterium]